ncbi:MAG: efflux RND transporter periplasmic adaptor subunit [Pseudomonadota bacterium]|nr:MAG: efflux RND transporter periplasmic adaptor subunit [Pseudomonadota bacterium]
MSKRIRHLLIATVIVIAVGAAVWVGTRPDPVKVVLAEASRGTVEATVANTRAGTVMACRRARLAPSIGGQIARLPVKEGDAVKTGDLLLEIWNADRLAEVELAEQEASAAKARAEEACHVANTASKEAKRLVALHKQKLASEEAADRAAGEAKARRAACTATRVTTQVAAARINVARALLEKTRLVAPFDGTVAEINGELGEFVTPSPVGIPTPPAVDLVDNSCLYVLAPIDEVDAPAVRATMTARVTLDAFSGRQFAATVRRVAPYVMDLEKQARTVDIEVEFNAPGDIENLLPGYSADAEVILDTRSNVLRIPTEGILEGNRVLVFNPDDDTLAERAIKTGLRNWQFTEVLEGLREGERITTSLDRDGVENGAQVVPETP